MPCHLRLAFDARFAWEEIWDAVEHELLQDLKKITVLQACPCAQTYSGPDAPARFARRATRR